MLIQFCGVLFIGIIFFLFFLAKNGNKEHRTDKKFSMLGEGVGSLGVANRNGISFSINIEKKHTQKQKMFY